MTLQSEPRQWHLCWIQLPQQTVRYTLRLLSFAAYLVYYFKQHSWTQLFFLKKINIVFHEFSADIIISWTCSAPAYTRTHRGLNRLLTGTSRVQKTWVLSIGHIFVHGDRVPLLFFLLLVESKITKINWIFIVFYILELHFSFYSLPSNDPQLSWAPGLPSAKSCPDDFVRSA